MRAVCPGGPRSGGTWSLGLASAVGAATLQRPAVYEKWGHSTASHISTEPRHNPTTVRLEPDQRRGYPQLAGSMSPTAPEMIPDMKTLPDCPLISRYALLYGSFTTMIDPSRRISKIRSRATTSSGLAGRRVNTYMTSVSSGKSATTAKCMPATAVSGGGELLSEVVD